MDAEPHRIAIHHRLAEVAELLTDYVEVEIEEEMLSLIERRGHSFDQGKERSQALLAIEKQERLARRLSRCATCPHRANRVPHKQMSSRMAAIQRLHKGTNLVARPDVTTLKLRELQRAIGDIRDELVDFWHL